MASRRIALIAMMVMAVGSLIMAAVTVPGDPEHVVTAGTNQYASLPELYPVPDFTLTDAKGESFSLDDMRGQVVVADFIFTACPGMCPMMAKEMKAIQDEFAEVSDLHFVSFSVDPETDTPEVLTAYGERYEADPERWHFLTGDIEETMRISVEGFKLGSEDAPLDHSSKFVLVDREGTIRGYYDSLYEPDMAQLRDDIRRLL